MKQTENYKLPNWSKEDRIMMDTFNDMTARLEAALTAQQKLLDAIPAAIANTNPVVRLKEITLEGNPVLDVSDVDWDTYREIQIYYDVNFPSMERDVDGYLRLNNCASYPVMGDNYNFMLSFRVYKGNAANGGVARLIPFKHGILGISNTLHQYHSESIGACTSVTVNNLQTVSFTYEVAPISGTYTIYGIRR